MYLCEDTQSLKINDNLKQIKMPKGVTRSGHLTSTVTVSENHTYCHIEQFKYLWSRQGIAPF